MTGIEIWLLKHIEPFYYWYPHKALIRDGAKGCAETEYGRQLMRDMISDYSHKEYCKLAGHGYGILARAAEADKTYEISCPAILVCGEKDKAGSAKSYNKRWSAQTGLPLNMIPQAGHNANTDQPEMVNKIIEDFYATL